MMSGFDLTDDVVGVKPFTAEFGCYIKEGVRKRMVNYPAQSTEQTPISTLLCAPPARTGGWMQGALSTTTCPSDHESNRFHKPTTPKPKNLVLSDSVLRLNADASLSGEDV
jgi:hypothetical protein